MIQEIPGLPPIVRQAQAISSAHNRAWSVGLVSGLVISTIVGTIAHAFGGDPWALLGLLPILPVILVATRNAPSGAAQADALVIQKVWTKQREEYFTTLLMASGEEGAQEVASWSAADDRLRAMARAGRQSDRH